jgi:hypothetical protein
VLNGEEDSLFAAPHHGESFFADLNTRVQALAGSRVPKIEYRFYAGVGHRPSSVNLGAANWLNALRTEVPRTSVGGCILGVHDSNVQAIE